MRRMCRRWEDGMKKLLKFLCGRIFITGLLLLLQAVWLGVFFWKLAAYSVWLNAAFTLLSLLIVLHILYHDDVSGFKIGWIILILQLPVMGGLLYLLFGGKLPAHRMRRRLAAQHAETAAALGQDEAVFGALRGDDARAAARSRYITATGGYPVCMDSDVKYYPLGEEMYADMLRALESAEHFIFLEYFIIQPGKMWDGIAEILKRKAAQGVDVRLICDDMGSLFLLPQGFAREMERSGVKTLMFNPFIPVLSLAMNNRDHRKIMDVDLSDHFTMGAAFTANYGDLTASAADSADGHLDSYYANLFGRYQSKRWAHTLILTGGWNDAKLNRTVNYGAGSYGTQGNTNGWGFGAMYELTYDVYLNEDRSSILQPLVNASVVTTRMDGYTETGAGNMGLNVAKQELTTGTVALGGRWMGLVGSNIFGREALAEFRVNAAQDMGDRRGEANVALLGNPGFTQRVRGAKVGMTALQIGAGLSVPVGTQGTIFVDGNADFRDGANSVNGSIGYRYDF